MDNPLHGTFLTNDDFLRVIIGHLVCWIEVSLPFRWSYLAIEFHPHSCRKSNKVILSVAMNDLEHVDEFLYLYCWCGHQARSQDTAAVFRCRPETAGVTDRHRDGAAFSTLLCLGIYQNKGENCTVPADMLYTIIGLQPTDCRMRPHADGEGWRVETAAANGPLFVFPAPRPAPPNVPRPACSHPRHGCTFGGRVCSERILRRDKGKRQKKWLNTRIWKWQNDNAIGKNVAPCPSPQFPAMQSDTTRAFPGKLRGQNRLKSASTSSEQIKFLSGAWPS